MTYDLALGKFVNRKFSDRFLLMDLGWLVAGVVNVQSMNNREKKYYNRDDNNKKIGLATHYQNFKLSSSWSSSIHFIDCFRAIVNNYGWMFLHCLPFEVDHSICFFFSLLFGKKRLVIYIFLHIVDDFLLFFSPFQCCHYWILSLPIDNRAKFFWLFWNFSSFLFKMKNTSQDIGFEYF